MDRGVWDIHIPVMTLDWGVASWWGISVEYTSTDKTTYYSASNSPNAPLRSRHSSDH